MDPHVEKQLQTVKEGAKASERREGVREKERERASGKRKRRGRQGEGKGDCVREKVSGRRCHRRPQREAALQKKERGRRGKGQQAFS